MRNYLYETMVNMVNRIAPEGTITLTIDPKLMKLAKSVTIVVNEDIANASPENKHARAFAKLRRLAPWATKRDVSLAIELALRG